MTHARPDEPTRPRPLRLWPGVLIVALQWPIRFGLPLLVPETLPFAVLAGLAGGLAVVVWWAFFSRAPHPERWGAVVLMLVALAATPRILHESVATGAMGMLFFLYAIPTLSLAFVIAAVAGRHLANGPRRATLAAAILLGCGGWALVRTGGFTGDLDSDFSWRWARTPEDRLLARAGDETVPPPPATAAVAGPVWPGFRGPNRDSVVAGVRIETDWSASPPVELWRRPIGPGWSSFAVDGDLLYTQEQRGDDELVACYRVTTGEPVWRHADTARFWESNGGAGPRGTPTLSGGRVYAFGGTGILNALDARDGALVWSRDLASDTGTEIPTWGFASSPLVVEDAVVVGVAGTLHAYDLATGASRWTGPAGGVSYSSPQRMVLDGVDQILLLGEPGVASVAAADGSLLWQHAFKGYPIVQPAATADGDVLVAVTDQSGIRRLAVANRPAGWSVEERWTARGLKPYFNDFVVHQGHAYGFDGRILSSIDLEDGERDWKGGRFGNGQLVLLPDQDLLLVLSELGELALVGATPDGYSELARLPAIAGKTWNHPVLAGDVLLVRNGEEMAAFRLAPEDG